MAFKNADFHIDEYWYQCVENAMYIAKKIRSSYKIIRKSDFMDATSISELMSPTSVELINIAERITRSSYRSSRQLFHDLAELEKLTTRGQALFSFFEDEAVRRRSSSQIRFNNEFINFLNKKNLKIDKCFLALDHVFKFFLKSIFGPSDSFVHVFHTGTDILDFSARIPNQDFRIAGRFLLVFGVPNLDVMRSRRWAAAAHEASHQKLTQIYSDVFTELRQPLEDLSTALISRPLDRS